MANNSNLVYHLVTFKHINGMFDNHLSTNSEKLLRHVGTKTATASTGKYYSDILHFLNFPFIKASLSARMFTFASFRTA